ncbi:hypothetical protein [Nitratiruptor sp. YY09-18]|uniref:hypothetical protein n=1 Tax=Nitratiruptor sp. YY09-18 TaxID=2724901 RepID=UPI001916C67C|nr:hypothetical protein [Nitratiruptor sp. YY09-18]BCD67498.1 hypothetical protein NitYY0918_C0393 [Nitratiruptor sp. YY09-18]
MNEKYSVCCINKLLLGLLIYGFFIIAFYLYKEYRNPIVSLSITDSPESIVKFDMSNKSLFQKLQDVIEEDLKKIELKNKNYQMVIEKNRNNLHFISDSDLYFVSNDRKILFSNFNGFKERTLINTIYISKKWLVDVAIDNRYFTKQILLFKLKKYDLWYGTLFHRDYLLNIEADDFKLEGDKFFIHSKDKWIKIDLNAKEVID